MEGEPLIGAQIFIEEFGFGEIGYYGCTLVDILEPEVFPYSDIWDVMMSTNCSPEDSFAGSNTTRLARPQA